jgi:hypothetical protein
LTTEYTGEIAPVRDGEMHTHWKWIQYVIKNL